VPETTQRCSYTVNVTFTAHISTTTVSHSTNALDMKTVKPTLMSWEVFQWLCIFCTSPYNSAECWTTTHSVTFTRLQKTTNGFFMYNCNAPNYSINLHTECTGDRWKQCNNQWTDCNTIFSLQKIGFLIVLLR